VTFKKTTKKEVREKGEGIVEEGKINRGGTTIRGRNCVNWGGKMMVWTEKNMAKVE